ncbi:hypothetical protein [Flavisolibacter ginsenosidimutans]|uniref:hypothetical protein n=1 Tax=Flavisolibacter ginsenosidimutans TaxID=661481 RepID=UPI001D158EFB|nr:hypothetical protein [Flavisolibacter ginsenosidimutans]
MLKEILGFKKNTATQLLAKPGGEAKGKAGPASYEAFAFADGNCRYLGRNQTSQHDRTLSFCIHNNDLFASVLLCTETKNNEEPLTGQHNHSSGG